MRDKEPCQCNRCGYFRWILAPTNTTKCPNCGTGTMKIAAPKE